MFSETVKPRFSDTDALGHINNTLVPVWFESARDPIFRIFMPDLNLTDWKLILAKIEVSFLEQMFYGEEMEIKTSISRIGGASFDVHQELWQGGTKRAEGKAVMVHYCFKQQSSQKIPEDVKRALQKHLTTL